ncbi:MAG TPA: right-handed parallel beta-helix repeat-containing protein [Bryobacteraceae bacterium]|nr:right-handed parallel beta-helix repeat-containing protein [Bryobacteraceae bacterium]
MPAHLLLFAALAAGGEAHLRRLLTQTTGVVDLPAGTFEIVSEIQLPQHVKQLHIRGHDTVIRAGHGFRGRALLSSKFAAGLQISSLTLAGGRNFTTNPTQGLPPYNQSFAGFYAGHGILIERGEQVTLTGLTLSDVAGMAILINQSNHVTIEGATILRSGSKGPKGRNNTTGGILLEEGTADFAVRGCRLTDILGNGIWTHSLYTSARNARGQIVGNTFHNIGRDAIQVGHATEVQVTRNTGSHIGYPAEIVDVEGGGTPVGIDTAGNVDRSVYANNQFQDINGKCIDLDGFHDGEVTSNTCESVAHYGIVMNNTNPDMQSANIRIAGNSIRKARYGGIFVIGTGHVIRDNVLQELNTARCESGKAGCVYLATDPEMLLAGIYLGRGAERPAPNQGNTIMGNTITGYKMDRHCITAAPGVSLKSQRIAGNTCK